MAFNLHHFCSYYSLRHVIDEATQTKPESWNAIKFCKAVKHKTIKGYLTVPAQKPFKIDETNVIAARQIFGQWMKHVLGDLFEFAYFIPVPSKDSWNTADFRSLQMVRDALPDGKKDRALPLLRFSEERERASQGGARGYHATKPFLKISGYIPGPAPLILIDDIVTSGGSLIASRNTLLEAGGIVPVAVVCGKTVDSQEFSFRHSIVSIPDNVFQID